MVLPKLLTFLKTNSQLSYSLLLIILIPVVIVANTAWALHSVDRDFNFELRREASMVGSVVGEFAGQESTRSAALSSDLKQLVANESAITAIGVLKPNANGNGYSVLASSDKNYQGADSGLADLVWSSNQPYAELVYDANTRSRVWSVLTPVTGQNGTKIGVAEVRITTSEVDAIINRSTHDSLIILIVSVGIILLLLMNHFRFYEYARLFAKLKEVDQMKDNFISMASHELRTPLTAISGYASLLGQENTIMANQAEHHEVSMIMEATRRLGELVDDLLNVSRIEQNRMTFNLKPTSVHQVVRGMVEELQGSASAKGLAISYEALPTDIAILVDEMRFKQVLVNLIGNAIKYTNKGGITISEQADAAMLKLIIKDTGIGMSPEDREHLFEKFYRIQNDQTKDIPGTGLGLWITKEIVSRMHGKIFVDSIVGAGTQFTISFPVA